MTRKIGFIGAGKVGFSLGRHIKEKGGDGFSVSGFFSRDPASASDAACFTGGRAYGSVRDLSADSDMLLLTVPDGQIADVWLAAAEDISEIKRNSTLYAGHCSGSQSDVFSLKPEGMSFGSMHPVLSVPDRVNSYGRFSGAYFTIEGHPDFISFAGDMLTALGNPWRAIETERKPLYHAACVFVSNLVNTLAYTGEKMFDECGFDKEFAENAWRALFLGNAENISVLGPVNALTGPVERADTETVSRHLKALSGDTGDMRDIYLLLSRALIETAQLKNPERDYSGLISLLDRQYQ